MTTSISSDALNYKVIITFKYKIRKSEQNRKRDRNNQLQSMDALCL